VTIALLQAPSLSAIESVVHGFTTRVGGQSTGALASLNLGAQVDEEPKVLAANRRAALGALGRGDAAWVSACQMHGNEVVQVTSNAGRSIEADGLWTRDPAAVIAILVADCVPILMADAVGKAVAAVHAGWRGTAGRIAEHMVKRLVKMGTAPEHLVVALGPAIGPCCFEVGAEVADELEAAIPGAPDAFVRFAQNARVDLWKLNNKVLVDAGVPAHAIHTFRLCTACNPDSFFSHRRDSGKTGRQAGIIGFSA